MSLIRLLFSSLPVCWGGVSSRFFAPPALAASRSTVTVSWALGSCLQKVMPVDVVVTRIFRVLLLVAPEGLALVVLGFSGVVVFLAAWEEPAELSSESLESTRDSTRPANFFLRVPPLVLPSLGSSSSSSVLLILLGLPLRLLLVVGVDVEELTHSLWGWSTAANEAILFRAAALFPPMKRRLGRIRFGRPTIFFPPSGLAEGVGALSEPLPPLRPLFGLLPPTGPHAGIPGGLAGDLATGETWASFPGAVALLVLGGDADTLSSGPALSLHCLFGGCVSLGLDRGLFLEVVGEVSSAGCWCPSLGSGAAAVVMAVDSFFVAPSCDAVRESTVSCGSFSTMTLGGVFSLASPD